MSANKILEPGFYNRPVTLVARDLLGKRLVRVLNGIRVSGIIIESEAYDGVDDLACHAHSGKTKRNAVMFGPAGFAYVYFVYGMHWCLNVVTGESGSPAAVLIRALEPLEGKEIFAQNRNHVKEQNWANGPAKLTSALAISGVENGAALTSRADNLWIETGLDVPESEVLRSPRVGIQYAPEPWLSMPWRFLKIKPASGHSK